MEQHFHKLVRDKIPEILMSKGLGYSAYVLDDKSMQDALTNKLYEELQEFNQSRDVEELADLVEVIDAILKAKGVSKEEFERIRQVKVEERGAFDKRIFLATVWEIAEEHE